MSILLVKKPNPDNSPPTRSMWDLMISADSLQKISEGGSEEYSVVLPISAPDAVITVRQMPPEMVEGLKRGRSASE